MDKVDGFTRRMGLAFIVLMLGFSAKNCFAQPFSFSPDKVPVGKTLIYQKSNIDGSNAAKIAVHYVSPITIEAFKWTEGGTHATKVRAEMDSITLNVTTFKAFGVERGGGDVKRAEMMAHPDGIFEMMIGDSRKEIMLPAVTWHSYDFDFSSLGYTFRFLDHAEKELHFRIYDLDLSMNPPEFRDFGHVNMVYEEDVYYGSVLSTRYSIDGEGLDNQGGSIWFNRENRDLVGFEIQKPDEPGYESGKLLLLETRQLSLEKWEAFQREALEK